MCFVIQTNYFIIPSRTSFWACNGKRKESKATVFCGNLIHEECWRCGDGVLPPFAPHPLAVTVQVGWGNSCTLWGRGWEGRLVDLEAGWLPPGLAAFRHGVLAAGTKSSCYPSKTAGLCVWKGFRGCIALQAFACHLGVKPWKSIQCWCYAN